MKTTKFFAVALAALTMFSCQKENTKIPGGGEGEVGVGVPTTARISLTQTTDPSVQSKAVPPTNSEKTIQFAEVFIFNAIDGKLQVREKFTKLEAETIGGKVFKTTTGPKKIYATVNIPADKILTVIDVTTYALFEKQILQLGTADPLVSPSSIAATTSNFWMTNANPPVDMTLVTEKAQNIVSIQVGRLVAKVTVEPSLTIALPAGVKFSDMRYKMCLLPRKNYLMPVFEGGIRVTPQYNETTVNTADYYSPAPGAVGFVKADPGNVNYITENIHAIPRQGNTTMAMIKLAYEPAAIYDPATGAEVTANTDKTFYGIRYKNGVLYSKHYKTNPSQAQIDAILGGTPGEGKGIKYTEGMSYHRLDINATTPKNSILRNYLYKVTIVSINGPGANTEEGLEPINPSDPLDDVTEIKAEISILPWTDVTQDGSI